MVETFTPELEIRGPVILIGPPPAPPRKLGIAAQSELSFQDDQDHAVHCADNTDYAAWLMKLYNATLTPEIWAALSVDVRQTRCEFRPTTSP